MTQRATVLARIKEILADDEQAPRTAIVPALGKVNALGNVNDMCADLARYRESSNAITRWMHSLLSQARTAQEVRMIEGFARQWEATQLYYEKFAGAVESAYRAERAKGKLATAEIENRTELQLAEMRAQATVAQQNFELFVLRAEEMKEKLLEAKERQRAIERRQKEQDVRLASFEQETKLRLSRLENETEFRSAQLEKEIQRTREVRRPRSRPRWNLTETAERISASITYLDAALRHAEQLFKRDPELAEELKQEIREIFRQGWRQQVNGQSAETDEDDDDRDGEEDNNEAVYADVDSPDWQR